MSSIIYLESYVTISCIQFLSIKAHIQLKDSRWSNKGEGKKSSRVSCSRNPHVFQTPSLLHVHHSILLKCLSFVAAPSTKGFENSYARLTRSQLPSPASRKVVALNRSVLAACPTSSSRERQLRGNELYNTLEACRFPSNDRRKY